MHLLSLWLSVSRILFIISTTNLIHLLHYWLSSAVTFPLTAEPAE